MAQWEKDKESTQPSAAEHFIYAGGRSDWTEGRFVKLEIGMQVWSPYTYSHVTLIDTPRNREQMEQPHNHGYAVTCNAWFDFEDEAGGQHYLDCSRVSDRKYS